MKDDKSSIDGTKFVLKKVMMTRNTISKNDVPKDIWNEYSKASTFPVYYLTEKHKMKRSPNRKK